MTILVNVWDKHKQCSVTTICDCGQTTIISLENSLFFPRLIQQDTNLLNSYKKIIQAKQGERLSSPEIWKEETILLLNIKETGNEQFSPLTQPH